MVEEKFEIWSYHRFLICPFWNLRGVKFELYFFQKRCVVWLKSKGFITTCKNHWKIHFSKCFFFLPDESNRSEYIFKRYQTPPLSVLTRRLCGRSESLPVGFWVTGRPSSEIRKYPKWRIPYCTIPMKTRSHQNPEVIGCLWKVWKIASKSLNYCKTNLIKLFYWWE